MHIKIERVEPQYVITLSAKEANALRDIHGDFTDISMENHLGISRQDSAEMYTAMSNDFYNMLEIALEDDIDN